MEALVLGLGIALLGGWIISILTITMLSLIMYPFDKKNYTHPKWYTIFPYHFKIQYKVRQANGQNLVFTNTPSMWGFPFLGEEKFRMKREFFTKEYMESDEYKKMRESINYIIKNQKKKK
jgi:hypothetical protein